MARKRLLEHMAPSESLLRDLARMRAARIKDHMIQKGGIQDDQIFMTRINSNGTMVSGLVRLQLALVPH